MDLAVLQCVLLGAIFAAIVVNAARKPKPTAVQAELNVVLKFIYQHGIPAMTKSLADLTAAIAANTEATTANTAVTAQAVTAIESGSGSPDFTDQVSQLSANTDAQTANTAALTKALSAAPVAPAPVALPGAAVGSPYSATLNGTGLSITTGALPAGLGLNADSTVTGTPTGPAENATFSATDSSGVVTDYTMTVS